MFKFIVFECGCISALRSSVIGVFVFSSFFQWCLPLIPIAIGGSLTVN